MKKSHKILKGAIEKAGAKRVASLLNVSRSLVYKWCQYSGGDESYTEPSGASNPLDRLKMIYDETEDPEIINWVCQIADGHFVKNVGKDKKFVDANILKNIQRFIKEFSEALDAITESYNHEKKITLQEAKEIRKEWEDLKSIGEGFVEACEAGRFNKK